MRIPSACLLLVPFSLFAEEISPEKTTLDPLVIVADKLLNESPATVTPLSLLGRPLSEAPIEAVGERAANFHLASAGARSFSDIYTLRGMANTPIFGTPSVTVYLDDLPLGPGFTFPTDLPGIAGAELHRGPGQNTRFGRAGSAGVLTFSTTPAGGSPGGTLRASAGNYDAVSVGGFATASSASQGADVLVAAGAQRRDGWVTNTNLNDDIDHKDSKSALARVGWKTGAVDWTLLAAGQRARDGVQPLVPLGGPLFTVDRSEEGETVLDTFNGSISASAPVNDLRITATTSWNFWDLDPYRSTLAFGPAELSNRVRQQYTGVNQEVRIAGPSDENVRWQTGVFGTEGRTRGGFDRLFAGFGIEESEFTLRSTDLAWFGEIEVTVSERVQVTLGLRTEGSWRRFERRETVPATQNFSESDRSTALLPKLGVSVALDQNTSAFAIASSGYKPGGYSAFTGNQALAGFDAERSHGLEAGVTRAGAGNVSATLRGFWYEIRDYQIERSFATSAVADDYLVVNAPRAASIGAELEVTWRAHELLELGADIGVTRAWLRGFVDPHTGDDFSGNRAPFAPDHDASLRARLGRAQGWFAETELAFTGRIYFTENEDRNFSTGSRTLVHAAAGYIAPRWSVRCFGRNLTDEGYYSSITPGTGHGTPGAPFTLGVEAAVVW